MAAEVAGGGKTAAQAATVKPIRTLIDPRLDFKVATPLRKSYVVASSMRSGSTFLCTSLWQTGVLGAPWEYINSDNELGNLKARYKASTFAEYLPRLLARRTSRNGVFGLKAHFHHFRAAIEEYPPLLEDLQPVSFVYIDRVDKLAQAVSMAKARQTKSWISLLPSDRPAPQYDKDLITKDLENAERQARAWINWFEKNDVTPFTVTYEGMLADKDSVVRSIMEFLGVENDEPDVVALPPVSKQADEANETWIARYKSETSDDPDLRARWETPSQPPILRPRPPQQPQPAPAARRGASKLAPKALMDLAWIAFICGFPCYEMARLRYRALSNPAPGRPAAKPNTFRHARRLIDPASSQNSANNVDTIYSGAWIDLSQGPLVIHIPKLKDRYFSLQFMDFFTNNFAVLGRDTKPGKFLLAGPGKKTAAPAGTKLIRSPTNAVWATLRLLADNPDDLPAINALQDQFTIERQGKPAALKTKAAAESSLPVHPLERTPDPLKFFDIFNAVLTENPPPDGDKDILERLKPLGIGPSLRFDRSRFNDLQLAALRAGLASARDTIRNAEPGKRAATAQGALHGRRQGALMHQPTPELIALMRGPQDQSAQKQAAPGAGWSQPPAQAGKFGRNYMLRARFALVGIGALPREQAMYFTTATDAEGKGLDGHAAYVLRFPPGALPPAEAFWSLTVYRTDENRRRWLVPNAINRYSIGDRTPGLRHSDDGAVEILIQHDRPKEMAENWLPVCAGPFLLTLRTYQPGRALLDGKYQIPLPVAVKNRPSDPQ